MALSNLNRQSDIMFNEKVKKAFSNSAKTYADNAKVQSLIAKDLIQFLLKQLGRDKLQNSKILDLGSGTGFVAKELIEVFGADISQNILQLDFSEEMCEISSQYAPAINLDMNDLSTLSDKKFDIILSSMSMQWSNLSNALGSCYNILIDNGRLVFAIPQEVILRGNPQRYIIQDSLNKHGNFSQIVNSAKLNKLSLLTYELKEYETNYNSYFSFVKSLMKTGAYIEREQSHHRDNIKRHKIHDLTALWKIGFYSFKSKYK
jgi:ubiquinone/menaquinone biosynthesis C-methylase UbiE